MSYSNITVVTSQGTFGYQPATPFVPISYNTLDLIQDIPHNAQLEVERIFSMDRAGDTNAIPNFLNDTNVSVVDKQRVFIIPTDRITYNINTKQITDILLPSSGDDVYNFSYTPISGPNVGQPQSILVPQLRTGDNIIIRRKTVSNTPLVLWTAGSKLTTAQLNLNTTQLLFLAQELNNKITITSVSTEQILDNAITTAKILNGAVTSDKLFDLNGPKRLLGSGNVSANVDGKYDVQELTLGDGFYWDQNSTVLQIAPLESGSRGDINIVEPRLDWRINPNVVTYAKMQDVSGSHLLGRGSTGSGDPQELSVANSLTISGTQLSVTTPLTDGNKTDITVGSNGTTFTLNNSVVNTVELVNNAVTYDKMQLSNQSNRVLGSTAAGTTIQELQVQTDMVANAAITNVKLAADAVDTPNIQNNAVTTAKINSDAVTYGKMQKMSTANRVLGTTTTNSNPTETQVVTDMVANNAVTFAKMQQVPTNTLLGRSTAGTGNVETITLSSAGRSLIDDDSVSDMRQTLQLGTAAQSAATDFATSNHTHGNITNDGKIGSTSGLPVITTTNGVLTTSTFGTTSGTFTQGNDSRLSDARTPVAHTHPISDVVNLQAGLDAKSNVGHGHVISDITNLQTSLDNKAALSHTHAIADVTGLQTTLDGKSATGHGHSISDVTNLQTSLDGKAASSHTHAISDVTGLQTTLDGKAASSHTHSISNVTGLQTALDSKVDDSQISAFGLTLVDDADASTARATLGLGTAAVEDVGDFAAASHTHAISDVTNLQTTLDGKAASSHTHAASDITSGTLAIARGGTNNTATPTNGQLLIGNGSGFTLATLVAGSSNITITNSAGSITIDAATEAAEVSAVLQDGIYGDIEISSGALNIRDGVVITSDIANDQITFAKLQNIATNKLLGRATAGSGDVEEIDLTAAGRALLDDADAAAQRTTLGLGTAATQASTAFAAASHTHPISAITNLQSSLDAKVDDSQISAFALTVLDDTDASTARATLGLGTAATQASSAFAAASHTHTIANVTNLQTELNNKAALSHTHIISEVTGLQAALDGKAASSHTHAIANVTGLQTALDNKLNSSAVSSFMLAVLDDVNAAAAQATLGLGSAATQASTAFAAASHTHNTNDIVNNAITYAKMQNVATANRVLGSTTAGGAVSETQVQTAMVADSAITAAKVASNAVETAKINDLAVTTAKLAAGAVTGEKITNHTVTLNKLPTVVSAYRVLGSTSANGIVSEVQITGDFFANSTITTAKIADGNVTSAKLAAGAAAANLGNLGVTTALLNDNAVTTAKITNLNVTTDKLANNAVTYGKMQVVATGNRLLGSTTSGGAVSEVQVAEAMIADNAVTANKINASAVTEAKIASNAVTTAKILDRNVTFIKLPASTTANRVLAATASGVSFSELQVQTDMIADAAITAAKIAPGAITISANDLAAGSITASLLATDSVITAKIQDGAVTNAKIANRAGNSVMGRASNTAGAVADITASTSGHALRFDGTNVGFGTIPEAGIADGAITTNKIGDAQVTGSKILDGAITTSKLASGAILWPQCVQTHVNTASVLTGGSTNLGTAIAYRNNAVEITPLNTNITPRSANSKVLVTFNLNGESPQANGIVFLTRTVGGVETIIGDGAPLGNRWWGHKTIPYDTNNSSTMESYVITYLDSPNTTNEVTYKVKIAYVAGTATQTFYLNRTLNDTSDVFHERATSQCILQEYFA